ncbi:hypothetical protein CSKR_200879 [Clonorchis sinensis]|uniref:Uncharacterized protein n=1 Tax=Clonorchis sinensis TaxID=79923 RepID=A0A8T1MI22_CLOSI|nr:hypothetical protein CSKR_200879 [Clonorchis sinensis]
MVFRSNVTEYELSPYETSLNGLPPRHTARLFNTHGSGTMSDLVDFKKQARKVREYNEKRRLNPLIPAQEELLSQLYQDQVNFTRRLGKYVAAHNHAVQAAFVRMQN